MEKVCVEVGSNGYFYRPNRQGHAMEDAAKDPIESKTDPNVEGSPTSAEPTDAQDMEDALENDRQPDQAPTEEQIQLEAVEDPADEEAENQCGI